MLRAMQSAWPSYVALCLELAYPAQVVFFAAAKRTGLTERPRLALLQAHSFVDRYILRKKWMSFGLCSIVTV